MKHHLVLAVVLLACGRVATDASDQGVPDAGTAARDAGVSDSPPSNRPQRERLFIAAESRAFFLSPDGDATDVAIDSTWLGNGTYIAAYGAKHHVLVTTSGSAGFNEVLIDGNGNVGWSKSLSKSAASTAIGRDGTVVQYFASPPKLIATSPSSGASLALANHHFVGPLPSSGIIPAHDLTGTDDSYSWWNSRTGATAAFTMPSAVAIGDRMVSLTPLSDSASLALRSNDRTDTILFQDFWPGERPDEVRMRAEQGEWILIGSKSENALWRLNMASRKLDHLHIKLPADHRMYDDCEDSGSIAHLGIQLDGSIIGMLRTDTRFGVFRSNDGENWTRLGNEVTRIKGASVTVTPNVVAIQTTMQGGTFCNSSPIQTDTQVKLQGATIQIVRDNTTRFEKMFAETETTDLFWTWREAFSESGRYFARWVARPSFDWSLEVIDLDTKTVQTLATLNSRSRPTASWVSTF